MIALGAGVTLFTGCGAAWADSSPSSPSTSGGSGSTTSAASPRSEGEQENRATPARTSLGSTVKSTDSTNSRDSPASTSDATPVARRTSAKRAATKPVNTTSPVSTVAQAQDITHPKQILIAATSDALAAATSTPTVPTALASVPLSVASVPRANASNPVQVVAGIVPDVVGMTSNLVYSALAPVGSPKPSVPSQAFTLAASAAFVRRAFEQVLAIGSPPPSPQQTAFTSQFTGEPSIVAQIETAAIRLTNLVGIDVSSLETKLLESTTPPLLLTFGLQVQSSQFDGWQVYTLTPPNPSGKVVVAIHGGAYVYQPTLLHWLNYASIARDTGATVVVPLYPLATAPNGAGTAGVVVPQMADLISQQIATNGADNVSVTGDSAGGGMALAATQYLVAHHRPVPSRLVLISPWLDVSLTNPDIQYTHDPLIRVPDLQADGNLWAGTGTPYALPLNDHEVSPLYGSLAGLPPTAVYSGSLDSLSPDALVLQQNAVATPGSHFTFDLRNGEIHDWALAPISPEALAVRPTIYEQLGLNRSSTEML